MTFPFEIYVDRPEVSHVCDVYLNAVQRDINPRLRNAYNKAMWDKAMEERFKLTDTFWFAMAMLVPEIKGMACGLLSGIQETTGKFLHVVVVQGPMERIKEMLDTGETATLNLPGSEMWMLMTNAKLKGFL